MKPLGLFSILKQSPLMEAKAGVLAMQEPVAEVVKEAAYWPDIHGFFSLLF